MFRLLRLMLALPLLFALVPANSLAATGNAAERTGSTARAGGGLRGIVVDVAIIAGGQLVISGKTSEPKALVRIEGTRFRTRSNSDRKFNFNVDFRTPDCRLTLTSGEHSLDVMIADCGPYGLVPRGHWSPDRDYEEDDLVYFEGSSWRARKANQGQQPDLYREYWQLFAKRGADGEDGAQGPQGPQGPTGLKGDEGDRGPRGFRGFPGEDGEPGADGIFADAVIVSKTCPDEGYEGEDPFYCRVACDENVPAVTGWIRQYGEGGIEERVVDPIVETALPLRGHYVVEAYTYSALDDISVAILCLPTDQWAFPPFPEQEQ